MADPTYIPKTYQDTGGDRLVVASGGVLNVETGGALKFNGVDLTAQVTNTRLPRGAAVAAAGSIISDAAQLLEGFQVVTGADGTKGVILPVAVAGMQVWIKGAANAVLKVWPQTGAAINGVAASSAMSLASGLTPAIFIADSTTQWYSFPLVPS